MTSLHLFTPAGVLLKAGPLRLAAKRLTALGFEVTVDEAALVKHQRFGDYPLGIARASVPITQNCFTCLPLGFMPLTRNRAGFP